MYNLGNSLGSGLGYGETKKLPETDSEVTKASDTVSEVAKEEKSVALCSLPDELWHETIGHLSSPSDLSNKNLIPQLGGIRLVSKLFDQFITEKFCGTLRPEVAKYLLSLDKDCLYELLKIESPLPKFISQGLCHAMTTSNKKYPSYVYNQIFRKIPKNLPAMEMKNLCEAYSQKDWGRFHSEVEYGKLIVETYKHAALTGDREAKDWLVYQASISNSKNYYQQLIHSALAHVYIDEDKIEAAQKQLRIAHELWKNDLEKGNSSMKLLCDPMNHCLVESWIGVNLTQEMNAHLDRVIDRIENPEEEMSSLLSAQEWLNSVFRYLSVTPPGFNAPQTRKALALLLTTLSFEKGWRLGRTEDKTLDHLRDVIAFVIPRFLKSSVTIRFLASSLDHDRLVIILNEDISGESKELDKFFVKDCRLKDNCYHLKNVLLITEENWKDFKELISKNTADLHFTV